jgi:hypothetical protein
MLTLSSIFWTALVIGLISFWWKGDQVKHTALKHLDQYCRQQDLQLLDQTIVLKGVWPRRNDTGSLQLRRRYEFEFTSTGEERYKGLMELSGRQLQRIQLAPHIVPDSEDGSH